MKLSSLVQQLVIYEIGHRRRPFHHAAHGSPVPMGAFEATAYQLLPPRRRLWRVIKARRVPRAR